MKEALSREKLNFLHDALDRELESVETGVLATSAYSNRSKDKQWHESRPSAGNNSTTSELEQLQKKLSYLEKKMEGIRLDEEEVSSHSLISETEVVEYRPHAEKAKVQFEKQASKLREDGEYPLKSAGKGSPPVKSSERKPSGRKQLPPTSDADAEETPLKRKYEAKQKEAAIASTHNSAKKPSSKKLHS